MKKVIFLLIGLIFITSCKKENEGNNGELFLTVSIVNNALNGDLSEIGARIYLTPDLYDFSIESTTAKFGTNQTPWAGVFLYTHEIINDNQPSPNFMTSLNGINVVKTVDLTNSTSDVDLLGFMVANVPTSDDSGEVKVKILRKSDNQISYLTVSMIQNALNGDLSQIGSEISLAPGKYLFQIESSTAKFGTSQSAWEGVFFYTHEIIADLQPAPNFMTTLNGIEVSKIIDLSNSSSDVTIQGFMVPNVPTSDDSGEVKVKIVKQ